MWRLVLLLLPGVAMADSLVATRLIKPQEVVAADAVTLVAAAIPGALTDPADALGLAARVAIYPGRPILQSALGPMLLVERNQIVILNYRAGGLTIRTEGRALSQGAEGELIEVLNQTSKTKVTGRIGPDGTVYVGFAPAS